VRALIAGFRRRPPHERRLLLRTALLFAGAHALSHQRDLRRTRRAVRALARALGAHATDADQLAGAILTVSRNLPGQHSCLIDALCCDAIAANSGITTELKIGAAHERGHMRFHAWVEYEGAALIGAHDDEFAALR
jgi:hypothetical protein